MEPKELIDIRTLLDRTHREGMKEFRNWLGDSDFYEAPGSVRHHHAFKGGLALHSAEVCRNLSIFNERMELGIPEESMVIIAAVHDICKCWRYIESTRNRKDENGRWIKVPWYDKNEEDMMPYGHGEKSVYLASKFIRLTDKEALCIRWHMGPYGADWEACDQYNRAAVLCKWVYYVHLADLMSSRDLRPDGPRGQW